jgi:hypothetical protein
LFNATKVAMSKAKQPEKRKTQKRGENDVIEQPNLANDVIEQSKLATPKAKQSKKKGGKKHGENDSTEQPPKENMGKGRKRQREENDDGERSGYLINRHPISLTLCRDDSVRPRRSTRRQGIPADDHHAKIEQ